MKEINFEVRLLSCRKYISKILFDKPISKDDGALFVLYNIKFIEKKR